MSVSNKVQNEITGLFLGLKAGTYLSKYIPTVFELVFDVACTTALSVCTYIKLHARIEISITTYLSIARPHQIPTKPHPNCKNGRTS